MARKHGLGGHRRGFGACRGGLIAGEANSCGPGLVVSSTDVVKACSHKYIADV